MEQIKVLLGLTKYTSLDDDFADKFVHSYLSLSYIISFIIIFFNTYIIVPFECQFPQSWNDTYKQYGTEYCFINGFINLSNNSTNSNENNNLKINYYSTLTFMFFFLLICLLMSKYFWKYFNSIGIFNLQKITSKAKLLKEKNKTTNEYKKYLKNVVLVLKKCFGSVNKKQSNYSIFTIVYRILGDNYFSCIYIFYKTLEIFIILTQIYFISSTFGFNNFLIEKKIISLIYNNNYEVDPFPNEAYCDFFVNDYIIDSDEGIKILNINRKINCILKNNVIFQIVFFVNFLLLYFSLFTLIISFFIWLYRLTKTNSKENFIFKLMLLTKFPVRNSRYNIIKDIKYHIGNDGIFIFRMISSNIGSEIAAKILEYTFHDVFLINISDLDIKEDNQNLIEWTNYSIKVENDMLYNITKINKTERINSKIIDDVLNLYDKSDIEGLKEKGLKSILKKRKPCEKKK
uniref:Innexin n=1 Tax=Strongyloides stercoralis TaxID=6248 RepID=A0A0K0EM27_STRER